MKEDKAYIGDEIVEGNKLIAEFDGFRPYSDTKTLGWLCPPGRVNQRYNDTTGLFDEELYFLDSELQYHSSWDWLMPVVEKISKMYLLNSDGTLCTDHDDTCFPITFNMPTEDGKVMFRFKGFSVHTADSLIESTWQAVVEVCNFTLNNNQNKQS